MRDFRVWVCVLTASVFCEAALAAPAQLSGPGDYVPRQLDGGMFYVPVAQGSDKALIDKATDSKSVKINRSFYDKYHAPLVAAVKSLAQQKKLSIGDQVNLFGWLAIETHKQNNIGYLWGGDLLDGAAPGSTGGIGFDCSGFVWSIWEAIAPQSVFANEGTRLDSRSYLKYGRPIIPLAKVDQAFIDKLAREARPGDVLIDPNGHICLYGYDPRSKARTPIVMENGEYWNDLPNWLKRYSGKKYEVRSNFSTDGRLMTSDKPRPLERTLPSLAPPTDLLLASASPEAVDAAKVSKVAKASKADKPAKGSSSGKDSKGSKDSGESKGSKASEEDLLLGLGPLDVGLAELASAAPAAGKAAPAGARNTFGEKESSKGRAEAGKLKTPIVNAMQKEPARPSAGGEVDDEIAKLLKGLKAFDDVKPISPEDLPPPDDGPAMGSAPAMDSPNTKPNILHVKAPALRMWNDKIRFELAAADTDGDPIVQYRVRSKGNRDWVLSDRPTFNTAMPSFSGPVTLEFQVVDGRGALSPTIERQVELVSR